MAEHARMVVDMTFDSDKTYMFTAGVDLDARSWMPNIGDPVRRFDGHTR